MTKKKTTRPTDAELAILAVLWERGPSTVREVWESLKPRPSGYTNVLKLLQIMTEKELVVRDESKRTHIYRARHPRSKTRRGLVRDLVDRAFGGSAAGLVVEALGARPATRAELAEIRRLIDEYERELKS